MMTREFRLSPSLFSGALGALAALALSAPNIAAAATPTPRHVDPPGATDWKPAGCRAVPTVDPVVGAYDRWHLLHGDVLSRNEVSIALAPVFKATWNAEPDTFNVAGVTFDHAGNLYFSPFLPHENVVLISLDPATGARRWAIPGTGAPAGAVAPMVLADPDHPGDEVVYVALYDRAVAVRTDGTVVWDVPTGLTLAPELTHAAVPGINYDPGGRDRGVVERRAPLCARSKDGRAAPRVALPAPRRAEPHRDRPSAAAEPRRRRAGRARGPHRVPQERLVPRLPRRDPRRRRAGVELVLGRSTHRAAVGSRGTTRSWGTR